LFAAQESGRISGNAALNHEPTVTRDGSGRVGRARTPDLRLISKRRITFSALRRFGGPSAECAAITSISFRDFFALFFLPLLYYRLLKAICNVKSDTQKDTVPASTEGRLDQLTSRPNRSKYQRPNEDACSSEFNREAAEYDPAKTPPTRMPVAPK
jgi:hypothetical protein